MLPNWIFLCLINFVLNPGGFLTNSAVNAIEYVVDVPNVGKLQGSTAQTSWTKQFIIQFLGIPYAESPSKEKRFLPPVAIPKWDGVRDAKSYGRPCPSKESIKHLTAEQLNEDQEDCLNLCVFTKNLTGKAPVMFFIHGGDFQTDDATNYPPHNLLEKDIILIVIQYRLGPLGFASTRSDEIPGNIAIMDIMLALKWTETNIQYFGGDPKNLMIFGQNSGGAITSLLLTTPILPIGQISRAIFQSGSILSPWAIEYNPIENAGRICKHAGCSECIQIEDINKCLKQASLQQLIGGIDVRLTTEDKNGILPSTPKNLLKSSKRKYPFFAGTTKHDGALALTMIYDDVKKNGKLTKDMNPKVFLEHLIQNGCSLDDESGIILELTAGSIFNSKDLKEKNYEKIWPGMLDVASMCNFKAPLLQYFDLYVQNTTKSAHLYSFDYDGENSNLNPKDYPFEVSISHGDDLLYLFNSKNVYLNGDDLEFAKNVVNLWTNFVITGKLNILDGSDLPQITNFSAIVPYLSINKEVTIGENYMDEFTAAQNDDSGGNRIMDTQGILLYLIIFILINSKF